MFEGTLFEGMVTQSGVIVSATLMYVFEDQVAADRFYKRMQEHLDAIDVEQDMIVMLPVKMLVYNEYE